VVVLQLGGNGASSMTQSLRSIREDLCRGEGDAERELLVVLKGWMPQSANVDGSRPSRDCEAHAFPKHIFQEDIGALV